MRFVDPYAQYRKTFSFAQRLVCCASCALSVSLVTGGAWAQTAATTSSQPTFAAAAGSIVSPGPQWVTLNAEQQRILQPLASAWNSLTPERKSKWLAMAHNYPHLGPAEQAKLQSRMAEWAALNPHERERARLNFAETKKISPTERSADWEAYQALSPEEKQKFADKARRLPAGAAIAPKPVAPNTLTVVPVTRRTTKQNAATATTKPVLDRNTLLPVTPRPATGASAPTSPLSKPPAVQTP